MLKVASSQPASNSAFCTSSVKSPTPEIARAKSNSRGQLVIILHFHREQRQRRGAGTSQHGCVCVEHGCRRSWEWTRRRSYNPRGCDGDSKDVPKRGLLTYVPSS